MEPRSYDSRPVNEEQLALLFEAARRAPSCNNAQEWAYYYTTREYPEVHARLAECLTGGNRAWAPMLRCYWFPLRIQEFPEDGCL